MIFSISAACLFHIVELRCVTGDGGKAELSLGFVEPEPGPVSPERRIAHHRPVDVSSLRTVWSLLNRQGHQCGIPEDVQRMTTGLQL